MIRLQPSLFKGLTGPNITVQSVCESLQSAAKRILDAFADRPHIFNLGHGIQQTTPIEHVEELVALVKGLASNPLSAKP